MELGEVRGRGAETRPPQQMRHLLSSHTIFRESSNGFACRELRIVEGERTMSSRSQTGDRPVTSVESCQSGSFESFSRERPERSERVEPFRLEAERDSAGSAPKV